MAEHRHYHHHPWGQGHEHEHDQGHHADAPFGKPPNVVDIGDMELLLKLKESIDKVIKEQAK